ncbi:MAG: cell envelope integrity protein CreD [Candidatus Saccharibacteria bacterium]
MNSYSVKMIIVTGLAIVLMIPAFLIQDIIAERMRNSDQVKTELYAQWGAKQVVAGPVLNIPYTIQEANENNQGVREINGIAHFLPETLKIEGNLNPEIRYRSIYNVVVYEGQLKIKGSFVQPDLNQLGIPNARYNWESAYFTMGISDMRGIRNMPELIINGQKYAVQPGVGDTDLFQSGITVKPAGLDLNQPFNFEIDVVLNGSEDLSVEALGKTSQVLLQGNWGNPSFTGEFLPEKREVDTKKFSAQWSVTHLNRNFPQQWAGQKHNTHQATLGVELQVPVDHYLKAMRSVKYAILFIALNFIVFLFIEIRNKTRIHPFQYALVAFALLIFYVLLTSISEQIGFNPAFLISAIAVTILISWYAHSILENMRSTVWVILLQSGLYLFLFTILQLQDYALLVGSIGLFVILAIIMKASQQIKWYSEG